MSTGGLNQPVWSLCIYRRTARADLNGGDGPPEVTRSVQDTPTRKLIILLLSFYELLSGLYDSFPSHEVQRSPSARRPTFGDTFAFNPMFTFFTVLTRLHFVTAASYEIYLPPNLGLRADGGLCTQDRCNR